MVAVQDMACLAIQLRVSRRLHLRTIAQQNRTATGISLDIVSLRTDRLHTYERVMNLCLGDYSLYLEWLRRVRFTQVSL